MSVEDEYRAALEKIAALEETETDGPDDLFHTAQQIAREALAWSDPRFDQSLT